ncbi:CrpP-related protein [Achromobacter xylosoxidans]|uniref:CrpP-related protein n=1 Tax=Alcaligenes xylosoxydans xylosoxydans TaxID=85698 RepID=UPI0030C6A6AC
MRGRCPSVESPLRPAPSLRYNGLLHQLLLEDTAMKCEEIQKLGAQAARNGQTLLDCPFFKSAARPGQTAEALAEWRHNVEAWEAGFRSEVRRRPRVAAETSGPISSAARR